MKQIAKALIEAQKEMGNAIKDKKNPFFKSSYADLNSIREACIPILNNHGVVVLQPMVVCDNGNYIKTMLLHESGESIESLTEIICSKKNDAQSQGSGITYARRYGLQSLVNIGAEDDDGNAASNPSAEVELRGCKSLSELKQVYTSLSDADKKKHLQLKNELKEVLDAK